MKASMTASSENAERLRKQAYEWLCKGLAVDPDKPEDARDIPEETRQMLLRHALNYAPLAVTRKASLQYKMPMSEVYKWRALWDNVLFLLHSPQSQTPIGGVGN